MPLPWAKDVETSEAHGFQAEGSAPRAHQVLAGELRERIGQ
jgi:hypothetical protein